MLLGSSFFGSRYAASPTPPMSSAPASLNRSNLCAARGVRATLQGPWTGSSHVHLHSASPTASSVGFGPCAVTEKVDETVSVVDSVQGSARGASDAGAMPVPVPADLDAGVPPAAVVAGLEPPPHAESARASTSAP